MLCCAKEAEDEYIITLPNDDSFNAFIRPADSVNFVMFIAPWCPHCQEVKPVWNELASSPNDRAYFAEVRVWSISCNLCDEIMTEIMFSCVHNGVE